MSNLYGSQWKVVAAVAMLALPLACGEAFRPGETEPIKTGGSGGAGDAGAGSGAAGGDGTTSHTGGGPLANGQPCGEDTECASGQCPEQDGVCCATACDTLCVSCKNAKTDAADGTCAPVVEKTDPDDDCALDSCTGTAAKRHLCDGDGACTFDEQDCGDFGCTAGPPAACYTDCDSGRKSCAPGHYCDALTTCEDKRDIGVGCFTEDQCLSGYCPHGVQLTEGICCSTPCNEPCMSCSNNRTGQPNGACAPVIVDTDPHNDCPADAVCDGYGMCTPS